MQNETSATLQTVASKIEAHGWACDRLLPFLTKSFNTAVGPRTATIWLRVDGRLCHLTGEYASEGRNALAPIWVPIDVKADDEIISRVVDAFVSEVQSRIAQTYAVHLYNLGVRH